MDDEFTIHIEKTESGAYRASVAEAPERHFATCEDPMVAVRGALAVARDVVDSTVGYDRRSTVD